MYDVFLICPVRNADDDQKKALENYIESLVSQNKTVYCPATDTNQIDDTGYRICKDNTNAIINSKEVHIFWDKNSQGSLFDLGVAFGLGKPLKVVNKDDIEKTPTKSFTNMILNWDEISSKSY